MVEVFKTNVYEVEKSRTLLYKLLVHFPENKINFDLDDCDKILRVEGKDISPIRIIELLNEEGHFCEILE